MYQYDANGNTLRAVRGGDGVGAYTYNLFGNQVSYTPTGVVFTSYTYRPDGLRHSIGNTVHLWDGANIVADIEGNAVTVYVRGLTLLYANDGDETYYHLNAHGDVIALTDEDGVKEKSYSYNAFGVEENPSALDDNPFRYCGEYFDKVNEKIYLRARYYDAGQGRFTQEDPIRDGSNWYSYCGGNPVMFTDPTGYALGILAIAATGILTFPIIQQFPAPTISLPEIKIDRKTFVQVLTEAQVEADTKASIAPPDGSTIIYRYYASKTSNLAPRENIDYDGLSFSSKPPRKGVNAVVTTVEAVNATGTLRAIHTSGNHYIIVPVNGTVVQWMNEGHDSIWTQSLSMIVIELSGGH
ncbi:MAG: RHS repeat-associated core domain-containing protein [Bacillales bacterium]|nr:RHS repeat-associated core domain-containing protein [Bacillales bacterium]